MRTLYQQQTYAQLEQRLPQFHERFTMGLRRLGQAFSDFWQVSSKEPRIWQKLDQHGHVYWKVYDPLQDCTLRFDDEQTVMVWLEEQHHRQSRDLWNLG